MCVNLFWKVVIQIVFPLIVTAGRIKGFMQVPNCQGHFLAGISLCEKVGHKVYYSCLISLTGYFARTLVELRYYYEVQPILFNGTCF